MKTWKKLFLLLTLAVCLLLPGTAFADGGISVQLNGETLQNADAAPVNAQGRVYVPFRAVFEALDADVAYDAQKSEISATRDGVRARFIVGENAVSVHNGTTDSAITVDAAPFIRDGRTYVPVRFAAQVFGLSVGWDNAAQTVVILDKQGMKADLDGKYTIMERANAFSQALIEKPIQMNGTVELDMQSKEGDAVVPITGTLKLNGVQNRDGSDCDLEIALQMDEWKAQMEAAGTWTAEDQAVFEQLQSCKYQVRLDNKTAKIYLKSDMMALLGLDPDAWYLLDSVALASASGMDVSNLLADPSADMETTMAALIDSIPLDNAAVAEMLLEEVRMFQDQNFRKSGEDYVSALETVQDGTAASTTITVLMDGEQVRGLETAVSTSLNGEQILTMRIVETADRETISMRMAQDPFAMNLRGVVDLLETDAQPMTVPAEGETIIDFFGALLQSQMTLRSGASFSAAL